MESTLTNVKQMPKKDDTPLWEQYVKECEALGINMHEDDEDDSAPETPES